MCASTHSSFWRKFPLKKIEEEEFPFHNRKKKELACGQAAEPHKNWCKDIFGIWIVGDILLSLISLIWTFVPEINADDFIKINVIKWVKEWAFNYLAYWIWLLNNNINFLHWKFVSWEDRYEYRILLFPYMDKLLTNMIFYYHRNFSHHISMVWYECEGFPFKFIAKQRKTEGKRKP